MSSRKSQFWEWYEAHKAIVLKVSRSFAVDEEDQNDLFQEIVLQIWKSMPDYEERSKPSTWIYRIALNKAISWSRSERRRRARDIPLLKIKELAGTDPDENATTRDRAFPRPAVSGWDELSRDRRDSGHLGEQRGCPDQSTWVVGTVFVTVYKSPPSWWPAYIVGCAAGFALFYSIARCLNGRFALRARSLEELLETLGR